MATLEEQRRANGDRLTAERQATGRRIEHERSSRQVVADLNQLQQAARPRRTLRTVPVVGSLPASRGRATYVPPASRGTGGGIASPLTETAYADRTRWPDASVMTVDGMLTFRIAPIRQVSQLDADDQPVQQIFANPTPPAPSP